jgi:ABC-type spermidine/putrescine transport system permease subunit I
MTHNGSSYPILSRLLPWLLSSPAIALLLAFFLVPLLLLLRVSFFESPVGGDGFYRPETWSTRAYSELLGEPFGLSVTTFTIALGVTVAGFSLLIGYPLALFIHSLSRRLKVLSLGIVILPKLANVFIVLYGMNLLLSNSGPVNRVLVWLGLIQEPLLLTHNRFGVLIAEVYLILPYAVLILVPTFDRIDPTLAIAARGLGASRWLVFRRITLPLSLPGVAVAGQLCLIWSLGAFVGPILLGGPEQTTLSVEVQRQGTEYSDWPRAAASAVLTLFTLAMCVAIYAWPSGWLRKRGGMANA